MIKGLLRFVIAIIFILSGFVKAVDLVGFLSKWKNISPNVFNMPFLKNLHCFFNYCSGVGTFIRLYALIKVKIKFTLSALIALCIFFGFLTFIPLISM
jgi:hypothetical protein